MHISKDLITFILIAVDVILVISILLQQKEGGLSTVFGGEGGMFRQKRGLARGLHYLTIVLAVVFIGLSVLVLFIK
jgi:protein translocase SecG subunit